MNNWDERLNAKVRAYNKVNARAMELQPKLLAIFRPFVGKKILTNAGLVAKLRPLLEQIDKRELADGTDRRFQLHRDTSNYTLGFTLRVWEAYAGEDHGGSYADAYIRLGEFGRAGATSGQHCDTARDMLAELNEEPLVLRTDYNAEEVRALREAADAAAEKARQAESALYPFGKYDQ